MQDLLDFILHHEPQFTNARLASLYSDFRAQRTLNPDGYTANISAWERALSNAAKAGLIPSRGGSHDLLVLHTGEDLLRGLELQRYGRPLALGAVIHEALQHEAILPLETFLTSKLSILQKRWTVDPWQAIFWTLKRVGVLEHSVDAKAVGHYIILRSLKEASDAVLKKASGRTSRVERVLSRSMFEKEFATVLNENHGLTKTDFDVLLTYMARDVGEIAYDGQTIKFTIKNGDLGSITTEDTSIASLKTLISDLTRQVASLDQRVNTLASAAHAAVQRKNRVSAMASLRSKKMAENALERRSETLLQLEQVYSKIEQAADQVDLVRVMQTSTGVLKGLHRELGGIENVEDAVEQLREEMTKVDEIGNVINEAGPIADESELNDELASMEQEEQARLEETRKSERAEEEDKRIAEHSILETGLPETVAADDPIEMAIQAQTAQLKRLSVQQDPLANPPTHTNRDNNKQAALDEKLPA